MRIPFLPLLLLVLAVHALTAAELATRPMTVGRWPEAMRTYADRVHAGSNLLAITFDGGFQVFTNSTSAEPRLVGTYLGPEQKLTFRPPYCFGITGQGLKVLRMEASGEIRRVAEYTGTSWANDFLLSGNTAFIAENSGVRVLGVANPESPVLLGQFATGSPARCLALIEDALYVGGYFVTEIYDVSSPTNAIWLNTLPAPAVELLHDAESGRLFLKQLNPPYFIADVSSAHSPGTPEELWLSFTDVPVAFKNGRLLVSASTNLSVLNVTTVTNPILVTNIPMAAGASSACQIGETLFLAQGYWGVSSLDITNPDQPPFLRRLDTYGWGRQVALSGTVAYVADDLALQVLDISEPSRPRRVTRVDDFSIAVAVRGNRLYSGGWQDFSIYDISTATNPIKLATLPIEWTPNRMVIAGDYVLVADGRVGIRRVSISNDVPQIVATLPLNGEGRDIAVAGSYAFGIDATRLYTLDLSNPPGITVVTQVPYACCLANIAYSSNHVYVSTGGSGMDIYSVTNPAAPAWLSSIGGSSLGWITVTNGRAYLYWGNTDIIDVSNPRFPKWQGMMLDGGPMVVHGDYGYFPSWNGLRVVDLQAPAEPNPLGRYWTNAYYQATSLSVAGNAGYVTHGSRCDILDLSSTNPVPLRLSLELGVTPVLTDGEWMIGTSGYAVRSYSGMPTAPQLRSTFTAADAVVGATWSDSLLALAAGFAGVDFFSMTNPAAPTRMQLLDTPGYAMGIAVRGNVGYVADAYAGMQIIQRGSNAQWSIVGNRLNNAGNVRRVKILDSLLLAADNAVGLRFFDISTPTNPVALGVCRIGAEIVSLEVSGQYAYAAGGADIHIVDFSNPTMPRRVGGRTLPNGIHALGISNNRLYALEPAAGILIMDLYQTPLLRSSFSSGGERELELRTTPGRLVSVQRSDSVSEWQDWHIFRASNAVTRLPAPPGATSSQFFRLQQHDGL